MKYMNLAKIMATVLLCIDCDFSNCTNHNIKDGFYFSADSKYPHKSAWLKKYTFVGSLIGKHLQITTDDLMKYLVSGRHCAEKNIQKGNSTYYFYKGQGIASKLIQLMKAQGDTNANSDAYNQLIEHIVDHGHFGYLTTSGDRSFSRLNSFTPRSYWYIFDDEDIKIKVTNYYTELGKGINFLCQEAKNTFSFKTMHTGMTEVCNKYKELYKKMQDAASTVLGELYTTKLKGDSELDTVDYDNRTGTIRIITKFKPKVFRGYNYNDEETDNVCILAKVAGGRVCIASIFPAKSLKDVTEGTKQIGR